MNILVIGGTGFFGRHIVEEGLSRGHNLTLFNRGNKNPNLFSSKVHTIIGDRESNIQGLADGLWDVVIDTCGYFPASTERLATSLSGRVKHFIFISSVSAYEELDNDELDENSQLATLKEGQNAVDNDVETYGPRKALCEKAVQDNFAGKTLMVRAGLLVGKHDHTGRFSYWIDKISKSEDLMIPDREDAPLQFIDAADLSKWVIQMAESCDEGIYNATGPQTPITLHNFIKRCQEIIGNKCHVDKIPDSVLTDNGIEYWTELPLCLPKMYDGGLRVNCDKAYNKGLVCRPLSETVQSLAEWLKTPEGQVTVKGKFLEPEKQEQVLKNFQTIR